MTLFNLIAAGYVLTGKKDDETLDYFSGWLKESGYDVKKHGITFREYVPKRVYEGGLPHKVKKESKKKNEQNCVVYDLKPF